MRSNDDSSAVKMSTKAQRAFDAIPCIITPSQTHVVALMRRQQRITHHDSCDVRTVAIVLVLLRVGHRVVEVDLAVVGVR